MMLCLSTMAAAGMGNMVSDLAGMTELGIFVHLYTCTCLELFLCTILALVLHESFIMWSDKPVIPGQWLLSAGNTHDLSGTHSKVQLYVGVTVCPSTQAVLKYLQLA